MADNIHTLSNGAPVDDNQNSITAGLHGPTLLQDFHLIDKLAHFDRERIPERVVHAKGAGAYGYFEVTHDITKYTKAKLFNQIGKRTPLIARFSTVAGEKGSADTERDPRGFAIKFYTEEGNWDMVGNNTPVFFIRDAIKFPDFIHSQKRHPQTNLRSPDMIWDFFGLSPEAAHQFLILFSDRGIPDGFRHMNGYSSHTFKFVNAEGKVYWTKLHFKTESGIKNLPQEEADKIKGYDLDYATRDLFEHIASGKEAAWRLFVQIMPYEEAFTYRFNPFDVTKVWPQGDYPLIPVGRMVLNKNPTNYFAEIEQVAFSPAHLVPGIEPSPDKMLQGRLFSYTDTHRHRLGTANYQQIPVNCPYRTRVQNYQRDGFFARENGGSEVNYEPNSFNGPLAHPPSSSSRFEVSGPVARHPHSHPNDDFEQPRALYRKVMNEEERARLIKNIVGHMSGCTREDIKIRAVRVFNRVDPELGSRIAQGLKLDVNKITTSRQ
eukprot:TRINITY_DN167_c0_g1_i5.p1 TRINITY_DN167_c0_g1~~TRINITY_DN167_c0_g1_i5.p1  ORF type:complete len:491 (-),score=99.25 TRINITY_DN167_c0_g1_i5:28-1500(-)